MEQDIPDYDMDSEDEKWVAVQSRKMDLTPLQFEEMMDRLEKSSGQTVVTLSEAKALLKEDDDLIIAVFDYWLNKRLKTVSITFVILRLCCIYMQMSCMYMLTLSIRNLEICMNCILLVCSLFLSTKLIKFLVFLN